MVIYPPGNCGPLGSSMSMRRKTIASTVTQSRLEIEAEVHNDFGQLEDSKTVAFDKAKDFKKDSQF